MTLAQILDLDENEHVVLTVAEWSESRALQTKDTQTKFVQRREVDGEWLVTEFIEPETDEWYWVSKKALAMGLAVPHILWSGPVNSIPDGILRSDAPVMVRCIDSSGWMDLRKEAKKACEVAA